jgi:hypothetical protein
MSSSSADSADGADAVLLASAADEVARPVANPAIQCCKSVVAVLAGAADDDAADDAAAGAAEEEAAADDAAGAADFEAASRCVDLHGTPATAI